MSPLAVKMSILAALHATWPGNKEDADRELFNYAAKAIAGDY
jgi:hypothetical protein